MRRDAGRPGWFFLDKIFGGRKVNVMKWKIILKSLVLFLALIPVTGFPQSVLTNGLVAYYPFNGNANEATGQGSNGVVINATLAQDRFGNANQAYSFDGATTWIQTSDYWPILGTNAVSVSCWINYNGGVPQPYAESTMLSWGGSSDFGSRFEFRLLDGGNGTTTLCLDGGGSGSSAKTSITANRWIQLAVVKPLNGGLNDTVFYVNGRKVTTNPDSDLSYKFNLVATDSLTIGCGERSESAAAGRIFNGMLDEVRIYNTTLSSNDVAQLYAIEAPTYLNIKKAVYLDSETLKVGTNYQLQVSSDLNAWTNFGAAFTATNYLWSTTNYWNVDDWNQLYFRLKILP